MSRCFPYLPTRNEKTNAVPIEALLQSIDERERDRAEKESRREKKREKKEKRRVKKEKEKEKKEKKKEKSKDGKIEKHEGSKERHKEKQFDMDHKSVDHPMGGDHEVEHRERSSLTEEHEQPAPVPKLYDSSDSTQNSGKKKKHNLPSDGGQNQCTMLRIRLPLQKHKDMEVPPSKEQHLSGKTKSINQKVGISPRFSNELAHSISGRTEIITRKAEIAPRSGKGQSDPMSARTEIITENNVQVASTIGKERHPIPGRTETNSRRMVVITPRTGKEQSCSVSGRTESNTMVDVGPRHCKEQVRPSCGKINAQDKMVDRFSNEPARPIVGRTEISTQKMAGEEKRCPTSARTENKPMMVDVANSRTCIKQPCPTSGKTEIITQKRVDIASKSEKVQPCSTSGRTEPAVARSGGSKSKTRHRDAESQLRHLIENWVPPPIQVEPDDFDDQEWLFGGSCGQEAKRLKANDDVPRLNFNLWQPQATYMPEIDMYALPYTVPF